MTLESLMSAILSVEWLLGASMALAFERAVRDVVNARLSEAAGDGEENER